MELSILKPPEQPADQQAAPDTTDWTTQPLEALVEHVLTRYHAPLHAELPELEALAQKVLRVHGSKDPERLGRLAALVTAIGEELEGHMQKEERVLFPWIRQGPGARLGGPISMMRHEHDTHGAQLAELHRLTDGFQVPAAACRTWRALWTGLEKLDRDLRAHIQLENDVLFPRALGG